MASKERVKDMIIHLQGHWPRFTVTDELIYSFWASLKRFSDREVTRAGWAYLEQADKKTPFPKPGDIISRIPPSDDSGSSEYRFYNHAECEKCGTRGHCIEEKMNGIPVIQCRECYTGLTAAQIKAKFQDIWERMKPKGGDDEQERYYQGNQTEDKAVS